MSVHEFLSLFEGQHTFQTFDDKAGDPTLARITSGDFEDCEKKLLEMNKRGAGIFFTVNETDGKGRRTENIQRVRAVFVDLDTAPTREKLAQVLSSATPPSVVVESSPEKFHCYWLVNDCPKESFAQIQKALATKFGGDPNVHDVSRVMRLPGFLHNKHTPYMSRVVQCDGTTYCIADVLRGLQIEHSSSVNGANGGPPAYAPVPHVVQGFPEGQRNDSMYRYACSMRARGVAIEEAAILLKAQAELCTPPMDHRECMKVLSQAFKHREGKSPQYGGSDGEVKDGDDVPVNHRGDVGRKRLPEASRDEYFELFERVLGPLPRDIFSGSCMVRDPSSGLWVSAWNVLPRVKSEADHLETSKIKRFKQTVIDSHFFSYEYAKEPILIPEIPTWDGVDRIAQCAECCVLDGSQRFPKRMLEFYLKGWLAGIFRKLKDPRYQNPVLILRSSKQGIGKDTLVNALTDGFGQWSKNMNFTGNDRDTFLQLSHAAVFKIAEFDKTSKTEMSTIKDIIFRDTTFLRASHERKAEDRVCRASFVATVNPEDFYRDASGHRRYAVFNLSRIDWEYPRDGVAATQILAQARALAEQGWEIPRMHVHAMGEFLGSKTPVSDEDMVCDTWSALVEDFIRYNPEVSTRGWVTNSEAITGGLFDKVCKVTGFRLKSVQGLLKNRGLHVRERLGNIIARGYRWNDSGCDGLDHGVTGE